MCNFPILVWDVLTPNCDFMSIVRFVNARTQEFLPLDEVSKNISHDWSDTSFKI